MKKTKIFLSYCWADSDIADNIYNYFKEKNKIELHRDKFELRPWGSIKEYMQSIGDMDYVILLISDAYLKSSNCMYEVLEVMRDRKYADKIFPAVTNTEIYSPIARAGYVKHWEMKYKELDSELQGIDVQNLGKLPMDLKHYQDIASNIAEFLDVVASINNPGILDLTVRIEEKLMSAGLLDSKQSEKGGSILESLGIERGRFGKEPSDFEINRFMKESYEQIIDLFILICEEYEKENKNIQVESERVDSKTVVFRFYNRGNLVRGLKLFLGNMLGRNEMIGIAECTMTFGGGNNAWNGMYNAKVVDGELKLNAMMSLNNRDREMTCQEVVADIWKSYVQLYVE